MNKENSMASNQMSTEIGDTMKSYSSKYKQLKTRKILGSTNPLPIKLERAAITIQRFWRQRMVFRQKALLQIKEDIDNQIQLLIFQNKSLIQITKIYESDCKARKQYLQKQSFSILKQKKDQITSVIKRLIGLTFHMQKKKISQQDLKQLEKDKQFWKEKTIKLKEQRDRLQNLISGKFLEEEAQFMTKIKQESMKLLKVSKQRGDLQKKIKQLLVMTNRSKDD